MSGKTRAILAGFAEEITLHCRVIEQQRQPLKVTLYASNAKRAAELTARNVKIDEELMAAMERWEALSA